MKIPSQCPSLGVRVSAASSLEVSNHGAFQRKNGYYYLQFKGEGGSYQRVSLETKNKSLAQEIYQAYLLDKLKSKLIPKINPPSFLPSAPIEKPKKLIKPAYKEHLETCKAKGVGAR